MPVRPLSMIPAPCRPTRPEIGSEVRPEARLASPGVNHLGVSRLRAVLTPIAVAVALATTSLALIGMPREAHALFGDDEARKAILDLRGRIESLQQDMNRRFEALVQTQGELGSRLDRLEQAQRGSLDQQNQMEGLRQEIARLRGQFEEQANEIAQMRRQQGEFGATMDGRLKQFEPVPMTIDGRSVNVDQTERRVYEAALDEFRASNFKGAIGSFQAFQKQYPDSPLLSQVLYWEGGARYASGDFKGAINTLRQLQQRHPGSDRIPDGLVVLGNAQADSGDRKSARDTFRQIAEKYPDTPAAGAARERLAALK